MLAVPQERSRSRTSGEADQIGGVEGERTAAMTAMAAMAADGGDGG